MQRKGFVCLWAALMMLALPMTTISAQTSPTTQATQPATQPARRMITLHGDAVASNEIDLVWYDLVGGIDRYLIERSDDHGKIWRPVGNEPGGSATAKYEHKDINNLEAEHQYHYRLVKPETDAVLSETFDVTTPRRNLLEAVNGHGQVQFSDVTSVGFWQATIDAGIGWLRAFLPKLLAAALIYIVFYIGYRITRRLAIGSMKRASIDPSIHDLLLTVLKWTILGFALVMACDQIGVHITALLTGVSIIGLAVGFAAQDTISNLIASVVIFWDKPFRVEDWVTVNGQYGRVLRITFRSTRVLNQNGDVIVISNTAILNTVMVNHSTNPENWVNVPVIIAANIPVARAREVLLATTVGDQRLMDQPAPKVVVDTVTSGDVKLFLSFCIKDESVQSAILQEYLEKAKSAIDGLKA